MKSITIFLSLYFLLCVKSSAQTKSDTEDWIISKLEYYSLEKGIHTIRKVEIRNNQIMFFHSYGWFQSINLKDIGEILIHQIKTEKDDCYGVSLYCRGKNYCVVDGKFKGEELIPEKIKGNRMMFIYLRKEFGDEELPKRMEKAILHLIKLYGGSAKVYKETF